MLIGSSYIGKRSKKFEWSTNLRYISVLLVFNKKAFLMKNLIFDLLVIFRILLHHRIALKKLSDLGVSFFWFIFDKFEKN